MVAIRWQPTYGAAAGFRVLIVQGVAIACVGLGWKPTLVVSMAVLGFTAGAASVWLSAAFVRAIDPSHLGRVSSVTSLGDMVLMPLSVPALGAVVHATDVLTATLLFGLSMSVLCLWFATGARSARWQRDRRHSSSRLTPIRRPWTPGTGVAYGYTNLVAPGSLLTGWDGTARTVTVRLQDGALVSGTATDDTLTVDGVALGSVDLHGNYVKKRKTVTVSAVVTASTTVVGGISTTTVTLVLGTPSMGMPTAASTGAMVWTPSTTARTPSGTFCSATPVTETGTVDREF